MLKKDTKTGTKLTEFDIEAKLSGGAVFEIGVKESKRSKAVRRIAEPLMKKHWKDSVTNLHRIYRVAEYLDKKTKKKMIEFDYKLDYKNILFEPNDPRYRIGRGEQGVLLVRPYTNDICKHWKFKTPNIAHKSAQTIFDLYLNYKKKKEFVGMDMCRKFLEMGFTRARRYANHRDGKKVR